MYHDRFFCLADYDDYMAAQERVNEAYKVHTHDKSNFQNKKWANIFGVIVP